MQTKWLSELRPYYYYDYDDYYYDYDYYYYYYDYPN